VRGILTSPKCEKLHEHRHYTGYKSIGEIVAD
jgi:hypothetical protein